MGSPGSDRVGGTAGRHGYGGMRVRLIALAAASAVTVLAGACGGGGEIAGSGYGTPGPDGARSHDTLGESRLGSSGDDPAALVDHYHRVLESIDYRRIPTGSQVSGSSETYLRAVYSLEGRYRQVHVSNGGICAIDLDAKVRCWIDERGAIYDRPILEFFHSSIPEGKFAKVELQILRTGINGRPYELVEVYACALSVEGEVKCWGANHEGQLREGQLDVPAGRYVDIATHFSLYFACGVRIDGEMLCWGDEEGMKRYQVPTDRHQSAEVASIHRCGLERDARVNCWGALGVSGSLRPRPFGFYRTVESGNTHDCGLRVDGYVECWWDVREHDAHPGVDILVSRNFFADDVFWGGRRGPHMAVTVRGSLLCGLLLDGTLECWGGWPFGVKAVPSGEYVNVSAAHASMCGLRSELSVLCWGELLPAWRTDPPEGIRVHSVVEEWS